MSTNREHPSVSAHEITLTVDNLPPLIFHLSWPVIAHTIKAKLFTKKKKKLVHLILTKNFHAPWPCEYGGRSKFDPDRLKHWKDFKSNGSIEQHMMAQFDCRSLNLEMHFWKNPATSALNEFVKSCAPSTTASATIRFTSFPSTTDRIRNRCSSCAFDRLFASLPRARLSFWCPSSTTNSPSSSFRKGN